MCVYVGYGYVHGVCGESGGVGWYGVCGVLCVCGMWVRVCVCGWGSVGMDGWYGVCGKGVCGDVWGWA